MENPYLEKITWQDIRLKVHHTNPAIANIIDELSPDDSMSLYKASYPYGTSIVDKGTFNIPLATGEIVPIDSPLVENEIKLDLSNTRNGLPPGIVLNHSYELFLNTKNNILPILVAKPGSVFALWKELEINPIYHPTRIFSITAGARSIFMLPNISNLVLHKNLKRDFNIKQSPPIKLLDQWDIFKSLSQHPNATCDWKTELLLFSNKWIEKIKNDKSWNILLLTLLQNVWESCAYERNRIFYDFSISCAQANRNLKPNPYLSDTLRHLIMIGIGTGVGFRVATDETLAPINMIQRTYLESYGLRKYAPTVLVPDHFSLFDMCDPIYYSLSLPTTLEFSPKSQKASSTVNDLNELKHILSVYFDEVLRGKLNIEETFIGRLASKIDFDFFHSKLDKHAEVMLTNQMCTGDIRLSNDLTKYPGREFSEAGTFFRGCIRLSHRN